MELAQRKQVLDRFAFVTNNTDVLMGFSAMSILMVMVIPIPSMLLDLFLSFNITFALIILLVGMYILNPLDLSSFPSLLLLATLLVSSSFVAEWIAGLICLCVLPLWYGVVYGFRKFFEEHSVITVEKISG